jgi:pilus assembly protein CpaE
VVLDVMMPGMDGYEVCRRLRDDPETVHLLVILLTAHSSVESRIAGFEAGADDFMAKPFHPTELLAHVQALLRRLPQRALPEPTASVSKTLAFFSLRGGIGVSTLATNTAVGLALLWEQPVALVDLALTCGQSAMMLNQPMRTTWGDLAKIPADDITLDVVQQALMRHETGVSVLAAPPSSEVAELVTPELVRTVIDALKEAYAYVVLDLPHDFQETSMVGLEAANQIVLPFAPEISSVYATKRALDTFRLLDFPKERLTLLMNWTFEKQGLARKSIEAALRVEVDYVMPYAESMLVAALNLGQPAITHHAGKPLAAIFEDLAYYVSRDEDRDEALASPSPTWKRVRARRERREGG